MRVKFEAGISFACVSKIYSHTLVALN